MQRKKLRIFNKTAGLEKSVGYSTEFHNYHFQHFYSFPVDNNTTSFQRGLILVPQKVRWVMY